MSIKRKVQSAVFGVLSAINRITPKKPRVFIYAEDSLYDNNEAVFDYLNRNSDMPVICTAGIHRSFELRDGVRIVRNNLILSAYYIVTSKVIVDCLYHALRIKPTHGQTSIQMWHGYPCKAVPSQNYSEHAQYYTTFFYPSEFFRDVYKHSFACADENMFVNGNPRNDYLFEQLPKNTLVDERKRNVIWMPTFRHGLGARETEKNIPVIDDTNIHIIDECLKRNDIHLFIKPHPRQIGELLTMCDNWENVSILTDADLRTANIPLYTFIGAMDALLTDYSSVFYDYLLLDKPIGFVIDDFNEYGSHRGYAFENPLEYMPGEKIYSLEQLIRFFNGLGKQDDFAEERKRVNELVNFYKDSNSCKRTCKLIREALMK